MMEAAEQGNRDNVAGAVVVHALGHAVEHASKLLILVADQKPRRYSVHRCVAQLLRSPLLRATAGGERCEQPPLLRLKPADEVP